VDLIPFNKPFIVGKELYYIAQAVQDHHLAGDGSFTKRCHKWLAEKYSINKVLLTHSCTAALEIAALLLDLKAPDEIIMPSYTFVSTANAFVLRGARIRFVDVRSDTLNLDETLLEEAINEHTKAIVPVHYAGVSCEMDAILEIAKRHKLFVIEDAAQGVNSTYKGQSLGSMGHIGSYSFHETKNFISGEGGALLINDVRFEKRAEILREKGTNRSEFFRGHVDKYTWVDVGSSYLPSELMAAFLYAQLEYADTITVKRRAIFEYYMTGLRLLEKAGHLRLPHIPEHCEHNAHMFYVILNSHDERSKLIEYLRARQILAVFHYVPLHSSPMGKRHGVYESLPVTEDLAARVLRLPCYFQLEREQQDRVIDALGEFYGFKV
jgi:dTDP-4-amino-4,6-dideoxygalactose transaminase